MSHFLDLPSELQTEIFTFLSVKHLGRVLSINKSTREEIMKSETFWNELINNYSRIVNGKPSPNINQINYDLAKNSLLDLIRQKQCEAEYFSAELSELECMLSELKSAAEEMGAFMDTHASNNPSLAVECEEVSSESERLTRKRDSILEEMNSKTID